MVGRMTDSDQDSMAGQDQSSAASMDFATERLVCSRTGTADVQLLDLRGISQVCDFILIGSGTSDRQMRSVADEIAELGRDMGTTRFRTNNDPASTWIVVDFVDVVIHLFEQSSSLPTSRISGPMLAASAMHATLSRLWYHPVWRIPHADEMAVDVPVASCPHDRGRCCRCHREMVRFMRFPGWPQIYGVFTADADGGSLTVFQANLLDESVTEMQIDGDSMAFDVSIHGSAFSFKGRTVTEAGIESLSGTITAEDADADGGFEWKRSPSSPNCPMRSVGPARWTSRAFSSWT